METNERIEELHREIKLLQSISERCAAVCHKKIEEARRQIVALMEKTK